MFFIGDNENGKENGGDNQFGSLKNNNDSNETNKQIDANSTSFNGSQQNLLPSKLSWKVKFFYSLGHVYNDLVGSFWFSYTLLFFQFEFPGTLAGVLILLGQVSDAVASPFIGFESDKSAHMWLCNRFGRRKTWHLLGTLMNTISVPLIYNKCWQCENASTESKFFYYAVLVTVFQCGWAAIQVSHVSLITDLSSDPEERITLNAFRQAATIGANICLYTVTLFAIGFNDNGSIKKEDLIIFTKVVYIVIGIGLVCTVLFHLFVTEPTNPAKARRVRPSVLNMETKKYLKSTRGSQGIITLLSNNRDEPTWSRSGSRASISAIQSNNDLEMKIKQIRKSSKKWYDWFKSLSFWKITFMYTLARMFSNVTQVYTPLYLQYSLQLRKQNIAIIPFATYLMGFAFSFLAKPISSRFGSRATLLVGCLLGMCTSVWIYFGSGSTYRSYQIYAVSALLGISGTAMIISSLSLTSDLIGPNTTTGAFVFAAMSFFDKSINGILIAILEKFKPEDTKAISFYKSIMVYLTGIPSIFLILGLFTIIRTQYGLKSRSNSISTSIH